MLTTGLERILANHEPSPENSCRYCTEQGRATKDLFLTASGEGHDLLLKTQTMLPVVMHAENLDIKSIWVAVKDSDIASTYVVLDDDKPYLPYYGGHHLETDEVGIYVPNVVFVEYCDPDLMSPQSLITHKKLCQPVSDHETIAIAECEVSNTLDLNYAIIKNRQSGPYVNCLDYLTDKSTSAFFQAHLRDQLSDQSLILFKRKQIETCWSAGVETKSPSHLVTTDKSDNEHWDIDRLMNDPQQCWCILCATTGAVLDTSEGLRNLIGLPEDPGQLAETTPADWGPDKQFCGRGSQDKMLDCARMALVKGYQRINFSHYDFKGRNIECDIWQQRFGKFDDLKVIGHIKRAVVMDRPLVV